MKLDTTDFDKQMAKIISTIMPFSIKKALRETAGIVLLDSDNQVPKTPKLKGGLKRSKFTQPVQQHGSNYFADLGYDMPYAHRLHEAPAGWNWSEPGSGPKYLSSKLKNNKQKYYEVIAAKIKAYGGL